MGKRTEIRTNCGWYNPDMESEPDSRLYRPELIPRRGEFTAWIATGLLGLTLLVLLFTSQRVSWLFVILFSLLFLSASVISLGNWMDRRTVIQISQAAIAYQNGLRRVEMTWADVQEVRAEPTTWGKRVQVRGRQTYFIFHTLGEVRHKGELKGRMGFDKGDEILNQIVLNSGLQVMENQGDRYYYARQ